MQIKPSVSKSQFEAGVSVIFLYQFSFKSAADVFLQFLDINISARSIESPLKKLKPTLAMSWMLVCPSYTRTRFWCRAR